MTRRGLLGAAVVSLTGCGGSPVVQAPQVSFAPPPEAEQEPWAVSAVGTAVALRGIWRNAAASARREAALALIDAQLTRLAALDPFAEAPEPHFEIPDPPVADVESDEATLLAAIEAATQDYSAAAQKDLGQPERLLLASAACAVASLRVPALPPTAEGGVPRRFPQATLIDSLPVALSHVWALIQGLEMALGRLPAADSLRDPAAARLVEAKKTRNRLRELIEGEPPLQPASFEMPTAMTTPEEIAAGWAELELGLLDGYARLTAVDAAWLPDMETQVPRVQSLGRALPQWPGWAG